MRLYDLQVDPILERHARALDDTADYRVLRRLPRADEMWLAPTPVSGADIVLGIIDTETTGLTTDDRLIEIGLSKLYVADGQVVDVVEPISMLEDPGFPLNAEVMRVTGLCDDDVRGHRFDDARLANLLADVDVLVAFNAPFDAGFLRRRFEGFAHPWICARLDFDWAAAGYESRNQSGLLAELGHFYEAHRAGPDSWSLLTLIASAASDGRAIAAHMVDRGRTIDTRITAAGAPFAVKDQLKKRGYRWQPDRRVWRVEVAQADASTQVDFLRALHPAIRPVVEEVDWYNRHCC